MRGANRATGHLHTDIPHPGLPGWWNIHLWPASGGASLAGRAALVTSRLAEPLSEHALMQWLPHSSLPDLLGEEVLRGGTDRYYRVGDGLLAHRDRIERRLRERTEGHFGLQRTIFLYDLRPAQRRTRRQWKAPGDTNGRSTAEP